MTFTSLVQLQEPKKSKPLFIIGNGNLVTGTIFMPLKWQQYYQYHFYASVTVTL
jgi:hypothetical protein